MAHEIHVGLSYGVTGVIVALLAVKTLRDYFTSRKQLDAEEKE